MNAGELRKGILLTLVASLEREREIEELCDDARPTDSSQWTAKDHLAHLTHWRRYATGVLAAVHLGDPPPTAGDVDAVNAEVYAANRDRSADDVKKGAHDSYEELVRALDDCSDEELVRAREGSELVAWEVIPPNGHLHLGEHLAFWHEAHGSAQAAESAQRWMLETHESAFTDPRSRAFGAYNLASYYARNGRGADALPHLKRSFELHPDLKEWAQKDRDLDRIREEPAIRAILV